MDHGIWLRDSGSVDAADLVECAVAAEDAGWDGVFVSDSLPFAEYPDPWVVLAGAAARTEEVSLGTWVVPVPRRQPWQIAQEVATLDRLSDGRVIFGAGLGNDPDYDAFGRPYDPPALGDRFDEALEVITGLWSGEPFSHDGEQFTLSEAEVEPTPVQEPRVPILAGCWWPNRKPVRRGARWDGIMPYFPSLTGDEEGPHGEEASGSSVEEMREALAYYHDVADDPGDVLVPIDPAADAEAYLAACEEAGATWTLTLDVDGDEGEEGLLSTVRAGPPG